nr:helix-turn-helix domain-containing protein [Candidatus Sigynarchaeum springense]MDO8119128.1 helix-turn-helix domain-containing protein [Candidatus Sigynarchaeota archaeon]
MDFDEIFDIMGNDVRRKILRYLAQGPLPIGKLEELIAVSRQAILKHLKDLEQKGFVEIDDAEKNEKTPGPNPHLYKLKQAFVIRCDVGPAAMNPKIITFNIDSQVFDMGELVESPETRPKISLKDKITELSKLNKQLDDITASYKETYAKKDAILKRLKIAIAKAVQGEEERETLELLINNPEKAIDGFTLVEISTALEIREDFMKFILGNLVDAGIVRQDENGRYYIQ